MTKIIDTETFKPNQHNAKKIFSPIIPHSYPEKLENIAEDQTCVLDAINYSAGQVIFPTPKDYIKQQSWHIR